MHLQSQNPQRKTSNGRKNRENKKHTEDRRSKTRFPRIDPCYRADWRRQRSDPFAFSRTAIYYQKTLFPISKSNSKSRTRHREKENLLYEGKWDCGFQVALWSQYIFFYVSFSLYLCVYIYLERERALRSLDSWLLSRRRWWKSSKLRWWPNTCVGCFRNTRGSSPSSADLYVRSGQSMTTNTRAVARVSYVRWKRVRIVWAQVPSLGSGVEMTWASGVCGSELELTRTPLDLFVIR